MVSPGTGRYVTNTFAEMNHVNLLSGYQPRAQVSTASLFPLVLKVPQVSDVCLNARTSNGAHTQLHFIAVVSLLAMTVAVIIRHSPKGVLLIYMAQ